jgi:hypothetical protein
MLFSLILRNASLSAIPLVYILAKTGSFGISRRGGDCSLRQLTGFKRKPAVSKAGSPFFFYFT